MLCAASEVLQRHEDEFASRHVLFAGDLQDDYCLHMPAASRRVHTAHYARFLSLRPRLGDAISYGIMADAKWVEGTDTLIYYWPKTKQEALMQLSQLCSVLPAGCDIFIVGENRVGVRSAESLLSTYGNAHKIDSARRCGLYHLHLTAQAPFALEQWWHSYALDTLTIHALTGVFSSGELDTGTRLLLSTLSEPRQGRALDVGCGAGVIGAHLAQQSPSLQVTLSDINAMAVESARVTLANNQLTGTVLASDVFSDISELFDLIVSNPPFHDGADTCYRATELLIREAPQHLLTGGELRIVANAFLPYPDLLDSVFGAHEVLAVTGRFKVYRAVLTRNAGK